MMNVLEQVQKEAENKNVYKDEKIASCLYYISFSTALRALEGMDEELKAK